MSGYRPSEVQRVSMVSESLPGMRSMACSYRPRQRSADRIRERYGQTYCMDEFTVQKRGGKGVKCRKIVERQVMW